MRNRLFAFFFFILVTLSTFCYAYPYPNNLKGLLQQYKSESLLLSIYTDCSVPEGSRYLGYIILVCDDYILFKTIEEDVLIIPISAITEIAAKSAPAS